MYFLVNSIWNVFNYLLSLSILFLFYLVWDSIHNSSTNHLTTYYSLQISVHAVEKHDYKQVCMKYFYCYKKKNSKITIYSWQSST